MTRTECEDRLLAIAKHAQSILEEYNPNSDHLSLDIINGQINISARPKNIDRNTMPRNKAGAFVVYATEFPDGRVWHTSEWDSI